MARMQMARATRSRPPSKAPTTGGPLHLASAPENWVCLVNISREQVQGKGQGHVTLLNPGQLDGPYNRQCMQEVRKGAGLKMWKNRKAALKVMTIGRGRKLRALAEALAKSGVRDAFFVALGRMFPDFRGQCEFDRAASKKRLVAARNLYKRRVGVYPPDEMPLAEIQAKNRDAVGSSESSLGEADDFDMFAEQNEPDIDEMIAEFEREQREHVPLTPPPEVDESPEPEGPEELRARVEDSEEARIAVIKKRLAEEFGVTRFNGRPGLAKLQQILTACIVKAGGSTRTA